MLSGHTNFWHRGISYQPVRGRCSSRAEDRRRIAQYKARPNRAQPINIKPITPNGSSRSSQLGQSHSGSRPVV
jgi:hypothetical protein